MTIARRILDERLQEVAELICDPALDIGGEKKFARGTFERPNQQMFCLNIASRYSPDVVGSCYSLPFAEGSFSTVLMCEILEHLENPELALDEAFRVLRIDGMLVMSVPFLYRHHRNPADYQRWTHEKIWDELVNKRGWVVEVFLPRGAWLATVLDMLTQGLTAVVPRTFAGSSLLSFFGKQVARSISLTYPFWVKIDRYLSNEERTKSIFHRYTTGYLVAARKKPKRPDGSKPITAPDFLRFPQTRRSD